MKLVGITAFVLLWACSAQEALLRVRADVGQTFRYEVVTTMKNDEEGQRLDLTMVMSERLLSKRGNLHEWKLEFESVQSTGKGELVQAGRMFEQLRGMDIRVTHDDRGNPIRATFNGTEVPETVSNGTSSPTFPEKAVRVGDSWTGTQSLQGSKVATRYTVVKMDDKSVHIQGVLQPGEAVVESKPYQIVIERATGKMLRGSGWARLKLRNVELELSFTLRRL